MTFDCKAYVGREAVRKTNLLRVSIRVNAVVYDGPYEEKASHKHERENEIAHKVIAL